MQRHATTNESSNSSISANHVDAKHLPFAEDLRTFTAAFVEVVADIVQAGDRGGSVCVPAGAEIGPCERAVRNMFHREDRRKARRNKVKVPDGEPAVHAGVARLDTW